MFKKAALILLFILIPSIGYAQTINIEAPSTVNVGESFNVQVNLETNESVYAAQFDLLFNRDIVEAVKISYIDNNGTYATYSINNDYGKVQFGLTCIGNCTLPASLSTITFKTKSPGKNTFHLQNAKILTQDFKKINISASDREMIIIKATYNNNQKAPQDSINTESNEKEDGLKATGDNKINNENVPDLDVKTGNDNKTALESEEINGAAGIPDGGNNYPNASENTNFRKDDSRYPNFTWVIVLMVSILILIIIKKKLTN